MNIKVGVVFLVFFLIITRCYCQEPRLRVGLKIGNPNIIGANFEVLPKTTKDRIAITSDFTLLNFNLNEHFQFIYSTIGCNYYILNKSKGLYLGLSGGCYFFNYTTTGGIYKDTIKNIYSNDLETYTHLRSFCFNPNIGYRFIWNKFSLVPEVGYSIKFYSWINEHQESRFAGYKYNSKEISNKIFANLIYALTIGFVIK